MLKTLTLALKEAGGPISVRLLGVGSQQRVDRILYEVDATGAVLRESETSKNFMFLPWTSIHWLALPANSHPVAPTDSAD